MIKKPNKIMESCKKGAGGRGWERGGAEASAAPYLNSCSRIPPAPWGARGSGREREVPSTPAPSPLPSPGAPSFRQLHLGGKKLNGARK